MTEADWNQLSKVAHAVGLLPLIWLAGLTAWRTLWQREKPSVEWWMVALGYGVSWFADSVALNGDPYRLLAYNSYSLMQGSLILTVIQPKRLPLALIVWTVVGMLSVVLLGPQTLWPLHTVVWLWLAVTAWRQGGTGTISDHLALALLVSFGAGWMFWLGFQWSPTFETLGAYQCTRIIGTTLLLWAMTRPSPFPASPRCAGSIR